MSDTNPTPPQTTPLDAPAPLSSLVAAIKAEADHQAGAAPVAECDDEDAQSDPEDDGPPVNPLSDDDSDDDIDPVASSDTVEVGFLDEPLHPRAMLREYFPCKVGGKPAWLNPKHLPNQQQITCKHCNNTMVFLMQSCTNLQKSIVCYRSQLPRVNDFYPPVAKPKLEEWPLDNDDDTVPMWEDTNEPNVPLCSVCGIFAPSSCSRCHGRKYCGKAHQLQDWKAGGHKRACVQRTPEQAAAAAASSTPAPATDTAGTPIEPSIAALLFPQKEINFESEFDADSDDEKSDVTKPKTKEQELLEKYEITKQQEKDAGESDEDEEELASAVSSWASPKLKDPLFLRFKSRTESKPDQVVRYGRAEGATPTQPLWVSTWFQPASAPLPQRQVDAQGKPVGPPPRPVAPSNAENDNAIPPCACCGGARRFEFQVLPQLLFYLGAQKAGGLDFANLVVYSCEKSCGDGTQAYFEEFTWIQAHVPEPGLKNAQAAIQSRG